MDARRRPATAMRDVVDVRGPERYRLGSEQPPAADPPAAWGPVLLDQAALGHGERPRGPAVVMPVGVLAAFPGQQPHIAGVGPVQGQVPAHIGVPDDEIRPQAGACRQAARDRPQLNWRKAPGRRDQAAQHLSDGPLALGAHTPAGLQPRAGRPTLPDAGTAWCASDSRHATLPGEQLPSYFPGRYGGGAEEGRIGPAVGPAAREQEIAPS